MSRQLLLVVGVFSDLERTQKSSIASTPFVEIECCQCCEISDSLREFAPCSRDVVLVDLIRPLEAYLIGPQRIEQRGQAYPCRPGLLCVRLYWCKPRSCLSQHHVVLSLPPKKRRFEVYKVIRLFPNGFESPTDFTLPFAMDWVALPKVEVRKMMNTVQSGRWPSGLTTSKIQETSTEETLVSWFLFVD